MLEAALTRVFAVPDVTGVLLDPLASNARARALYARLGFVDLGPWRFGDDDCRVLWLSRADWLQRCATGRP